MKQKKLKLMIGLLELLKWIQILNYLLIKKEIKKSQ